MMINLAKHYTITAIAINLMFRLDVQSLDKSSDNPKEEMRSKVIKYKFLI